MEGCDKKTKKNKSTWNSVEVTNIPNKSFIISKLKNSVCSVAKCIKIKYREFDESNNRSNQIVLDVQGQWFHLFYCYNSLTGEYNQILVNKSYEISDSPEKDVIPKDVSKLINQIILDHVNEPWIIKFLS